MGRKSVTDGHTNRQTDGHQQNLYKDEYSYLQEENMIYKGRYVYQVIQTIVFALWTNLTQIVVYSNPSTLFENGNFIKYIFFLWIN